jgi:hypothetical protein
MDNVKVVELLSETEGESKLIWESCSASFRNAERTE